MRATILLVDDDPVDRNALRLLVESWGHHTISVASGPEALERMATHKYDVIFMDLLMPEMDGYQATIQIRKEGHTLPIIAMSADEDDITRKAAFDAGMNEYVMKPARVENIKQLLIKLFSTTI